MELQYPLIAPMRLCYNTLPQNRILIVQGTFIAFGPPAVQREPLTLNPQHRQQNQRKLPNPEWHALEQAEVPTCSRCSCGFETAVPKASFIKLLSWTLSCKLQAFHIGFYSILENNGKPKFWLAIEWCNYGGLRFWVSGLGATLGFRVCLHCLPEALGSKSSPKKISPKP